MASTRKGKGMPRSDSGGMRTMQLKVTASGVGSSSGSSGKQGSTKAAQPARLQSIASNNPADGSDLRVSQKVKLPEIRSVMVKFEDMLRGSLEDLPPKPPSEVRIFLSSTFSDMRCERNWLYVHAFPRLKAFCAGLDLDFQVLDMRWGVTDDATNEHITETLCLQEVRNCQKTSLGPNFVVLLGDKYGYRPLPNNIPTEDFETILAEIKGTTDASLLSEWYCKDENAMPPVFVLQPITSHLTHFADPDPAHDPQRRADTATWWRTLDDLRLAFRKGAEGHLRKVLKLQSQGKSQEISMENDKFHSYFRSVTECEVAAGILEAAQPEQHALCFVRHFTGLDEHTPMDAKIPRFIDCITENGQTQIDMNVAGLRQDLINNKMPKALPKNSIYTHEVPWQTGGVDPGSNGGHREYLNAFCEQFTQDIERLITGGLHAKRTCIPASEYYTDYEELLHHMHFTRIKCATFRGRQDVIAAVRAILDNPKKRKPMVIYAESGVGKTSIMAKLMEEIPKWYGKEAICIVRYLGTSLFSSDIYCALRGVAGQMADSVDTLMEPQGYRTMKTLQTYFPRLMRQVARGKAGKRRIFILMDSLDQLAPSYGAHEMKWLPLELPTNVSIILSTLPKHYGCLDNLRKLIRDPELFIEVQGIDEAVGMAMVEAYLSSKNRRLTDGQMGIIKTQLLSQPTPLLIKILLDKALQWRSSTIVDPGSLSSTVQGAITRLYQTLEEKFGVILVSHALGYLTCGLDGLTEVELEDILSLDDAVLDEVYHYHDPPIEGVIRIPPLLWSRVKQDINEYLTERKSSNKTTLYWYHRQFIECAVDRYATGSGGIERHLALADMYSSEHGVRRTIVLSKRKEKCIENADRQVSSQPLSPSNPRVIHALLHHLTKAQAWERLKKQALCNLRFMSTRIKASSVDTLLGDYEKTIGCLKALQQSDYDLELLVSLLRQSRLTSASLLPLEVVARLDGDFHPDTSLQQLRQQALQELETGSSAALIPLYPCLASADINEWKLTGCREVRMVSYNGKRMVVGLEKPMDEGVQWAIIDLDHKYVVKKSDESSIVMSSDGKYSIRLTNSKKSPPGTLLVCKEKLGSQECPTITLASQASKQTLDVNSLAVNAEATKLAVVHEKKFISIWDLSKQKQLRSSIAFKGWTEFYLITFVSNDNIIGLVRNGDGQGGIAHISNSPKGDNFAIDLPSILTQDTMQIDQRGARVVGKTVSPNGSNTLLYVEFKTRDVRTLVESFEGPFLVHPLWQCVYFVEHGGVACVSLENYESRTQLGSVEGDVSALAMDEDGEHLVVASSQAIDIWWAESGHHVGRLEVGQVTYLAVTQYGEDYMVALNKDGVLNVYNWKLLLQRVGSSEDSSKRIAENLDQQSLIKETHVEYGLFLSEHSLCTISTSGFLAVWSTETFSAVHSTVLGWCCAMVESVSENRLFLLTQEGRIFVWDQRKPTETNPIPTEGEVLIFCLNAFRTKAYILVKRRSLCVICVDAESLTVLQSWDITGKADISDATMRLSSNEQYIVVKNRCTETELDIICKSELKNRLHSLNNCPYKVLGLDLSQSPCSWRTCLRYLTKIPMRVHTLDMIGEALAVTGRGRIATVWDLAQDKCDQILVKGTKTPQFFRPSWLETDETWKTVCDGDVRCSHLSLDGATLVMGSEDGWVMHYSAATGKCVQQNLNPKKPHHPAPVEVVCVSPHSRWVASFSTDRSFKIWTVGEGGKEVTCLRLPAKVKDMEFSADDQLLYVLAEYVNQTTRVLLFKMKQ